MDSSDALTKLIHEEAAKLEKFHDEIISCKVVFEAVGHGKGDDGRSNVRIDLHVPGYELFAEHKPSTDGAHEDAYSAIRDAFSQMRRELKKHAQLQREGGRHRPTR